jgi:hypothetical protein
MTLKASLESTGELLLYPLVKNGRAEAPDPADLQSTNLPAPRHPLERLRMDFQDRGRLVRVKQWLCDEYVGRKRLQASHRMFSISSRLSFLRNAPHG